MNCLDYRRRLYAEGEENAELRAHRLACPACSECFAEHQPFERGLRDALRVPVPEDFAGRLARNLRPAGGEAAAPAPARRRLLAAAAGLAVLGLGGALYLWRGRDDLMALACIQFVMRDEAKSLMMGAMPREEAARMLADTLPLERIERLGQVRHVAPCPFGAGTAYHVILMVPQEKVTLLVMPDTPAPGRESATEQGMHAAVVPLARGSVGIVAASAAVVGSIAAAIRV